MTAESTSEIVDQFVRALGRPAFDAELSWLALDAARTLARVPSEQLVPHVVPIVTALANWFRVTGGDAAIDRAAEVLAQIEPRALAAALEGVLGAGDEAARGGWLRELNDLAFACPALSPVLALLAPRQPGHDAPFEAEVRSFAPYVDAFLAALAEKAALGSVGAYKAAVRARLRSPRVLDRYRALEWAALSLLTEEEKQAIVVDPSAHAPAPNFDLVDFSVCVNRRVVEVVADPATEIDRAELRELDPDCADEVELGETVGVFDSDRTHALKAAALRAFGL
ncbi:hypothetical protein [Nannocystis punicea]|uniref:DUF4393 domain-containing protein n=1 Tax=Nannocystis punicea TaxID=2995304 RepID=A0ABY7GS08_9BACT|nr:hypothetical protein [Nannocystis poenicansa]WAS89718.1 hypothetical protein O0S08_26290 [Nannocystis poenicansa]